MSETDQPQRSAAEAPAQAANAGATKSPETEADKLAAKANARLPRLSLALLSLLHGLIFAWAARVLPWADWTVFALLSTLVAALHLATALLALLRHRALALVWRMQAAASILLLAYVGWGLLSSAWYVSRVYSGLGEGLGVALLAVFGLLVTLTLPLSLWGFLATGGVRLRRASGLALALIVALGGIQLLRLDRLAQGEPIASDAQIAEVQTALAALASKSPRQAGKRTSLMTHDAAPCLPSADQLTLVATFQRKDPAARRGTRLVSECLHAASADQLAAQLNDRLAEARGPVKLDLLIRQYALPGEAWLAGLVVRPGLDGACGGTHCLMPWQLSAMDMFTTRQLIPSVPDARLGVSLDALRKHLKIIDKNGPIKRLSTVGWLLEEDGELLALGRAPRVAVEVTAAEIEQAERLARAHIYAAQGRDGTFRYLLQPHTGHAHNGGFSVPRQAGTTLAVCELGGQDRHARRVAQRSLDMLATLEQPLGSVGEGARGVLLFPKGSKPSQAGIGASALSLAAALRCRPMLGGRYDALIGRLARMLLAQQRPDGSFRHFLDAVDGTVVDAPGSLYVDGQAVLGLTLLEEIAGEQAGEFPARARLHEAVDKAMEFYGNQYWHIALRPFLFLEENWHCIAAAASLYHHRHDAYERFCLDYVQFKRRIVLDANSDVHPEFIGGYAFGNIVPPHNTATAGFGEALAAAMKVKRARNLPLDEDIALMRSVLGFLLNNQWQRSSCYACSTRQLVIGGFSEHMASPNIRIDYVQHAWAAIGHGARAAGLVAEPAAERGGERGG